MIDIIDIKIIEMIYDIHEWKSKERKMQKILNWSILKFIKNIYTFINIYIYYQIFIISFSIIIILIFNLFQKKKWFLWINKYWIIIKKLK